MMHESITLRFATIQDTELLFEWRNDQETRKYSHNTEIVTMNEHISWMNNTLNNPHRKLFIVEEYGIPVGTVRADFSQGVWQLSWTVARNWRGHGIAKRMVYLLASLITEPICAEIKVDNKSSARIAECAGMMFDHEAEGIAYYQRASKTNQFYQTMVHEPMTPRRYTCLHQEPLKSGSFALVTVQDEHIEPIRLWRNAQMNVLRQMEPITPEQQQRYYEEQIWPTLDQPHPKQILLSFLEGEQHIGYGGLVHIAWEHQRAEVSFLLDPALAADVSIHCRYFARYLDLVKQLAFSTFGLHRLHTETFAIRTDLIRELEANGFLREGRMRSHVRIDGVAIDALIHGCLHDDH